MKLELVDRRGGVTEPDPWCDADWPRLVVLAAAAGPPHWVLDLVLLPDRDMADLNEHWRQQPGPTDVLSFSYLLPRGEGLADLGKGKGLARHDLWLDPMETGELPAGVEGESGVPPLKGREYGRVERGRLFIDAG